MHEACGRTMLASRRGVNDAHVIMHATMAHHPTTPGWHNRIVNFTRICDPIE